MNFTNENKRHSIQFTCNEDGEVTRIIEDENKFLPVQNSDSDTNSLIPASEKSRFQKLILHAKKFGFGFCRDLKLSNNKDEPLNFCLFCVIISDSIIVLAIQMSTHSNLVFDEFMKMFNDQSKLLRAAQKEVAVKVNEQRDIIDNYTKSNNELAKLHRELQKKTAQLQQAYDTIEEINRRDSLTQALNRHHFMLQSNQELSRCTRYELDCCLLYLDIDHFKMINDTGGHAAGDFILKRFVELCREQLRENDIIGRMGGEEFCILLVHSSLNESITTAERIRTIIENEVYLFDNLPFTITTSIGIAENNHDTVDSLLKRADSALYLAKRTGRNRTCTEQSV